MSHKLTFGGSVVIFNASLEYRYGESRMGGGAKPESEVRVGRLVL